jgi:acyl-CoA dehydrogenase
VLISPQVGNSYMNIPIAITVEGANILTRSMITFGQGLNRAHPYLINIVNSIGTA